jgi:glycosyltransferase involved in cell wall biosynthesis
MKVLYLVTKSERGGAQVHVLDLIRALGDRVHPIVACGDDGFLLAECRKLGIETHVVPELVHPVRPLQDVRAVLAVRALLRRCRADLIHGHTGKAGLIARLAGRLTQTPSFYTVHSWSFVGTGRRTAAIAVWLERAARLTGGTVIEVCRANFAMARKRGVVSPAHHLTIWNGVPDTPLRARPVMGRPIRILMAARFVFQKQHSVLLHALAGITRSSWHLTLAGDGPLRAEMQQLAMDLGVQDRVLFTGDTDQVSSLLADSDVFVLSTRQESLPLSIIEAMRAGLPVVASDVGGVAELVTHGVTGYLVPHSDPQALQERLRELIASGQTRSRMGQMGRLQYERHFTVEKMAGAVLSLYREHHQIPKDKALILEPTGATL